MKHWGRRLFREKQLTDMEPIIRHFTDDDLYKFTMCCAVIDNYPRAQVKYSFIDRNNMVYPDGFAGELARQIAFLEDLRITDEEIAFMRRRCRYLPEWFFTYLKGFRYDRRWVNVNQDAAGHLSVDIEGAWSNTILLEVKLLAIISELYYRMTGQAERLDYNECERRAAKKAGCLIGAGCVFSDFGTRRRASFASQDCVVRAMSGINSRMDGPGRFAGTSNVYLAMKYDVVPMGTMAHELICAMAGYEFEKYRSKGKNVVYAMFLLSMMIPFSAQIIPLFKMASRANMLDSFLTMQKQFVEGIVGSSK